MRKYYFDFLHNNTLTRDDEGSEHPTDDAARHEMRLAMLEISRGAVRFEEPWQLVGILRTIGATSGAAGSRSTPRLHR